VDVVDSKTNAGPVMTITLTDSDIARLTNGEGLAFSDPETKIRFDVQPEEAAEYLVEVGPDALEMFKLVLAGWLTVFTDGSWRMTLQRDQGEFVLVPLAIGAKTTRTNTTVDERTIEIVAATPKKK